MMTQNPVAANAVRGSVAGAIATLGMTAVMVYLHRRLPAGQRYGLPPEQIVDELLDRADADDQLTDTKQEAFAMAVHHGYGTAMGAAYGVLEPHLRSKPVLNGMGFGIVVWAAGYLGWLPALRMDASASREPMQRNALTIASHLVWGAITGAIAARRSPVAANRERSRLPDRRATQHESNGKHLQRLGNR